MSSSEIQLRESLVLFLLKKTVESDIRSAHGEDLPANRPRLPEDLNQMYPLLSTKFQQERPAGITLNGERLLKQKTRQNIGFTCPDDELLDAYVLGSIARFQDPVEVEILGIHLSSCLICRTRVETHELIVSALRELL